MGVWAVVVHTMAPRDLALQEHLCYCDSGCVGLYELILWVVIVIREF